MNDQFLQGVIFDWDRIDNDSYLKRIKAFKGIQKLDFNKAITFFVGENGSGKSVKIQASLYPNSDYLTNSELFRKEFDMYFPIFILVFYIKYILLHLIRLLTIVGFPLTLRQFHICKYRFKR